MPRTAIKHSRMPRLRKAWANLLTLMVLLCTSAQAQDSVEIDKIVIYKPSEKFTIPKSSGQISFANTATAPLSLGTTLSRQAGLNLTQYGGLTAETTLSVRGSNSRHLQIFWDGIPLNTASGQGLQIQNIPTSQIQKIQIFKSQTPAEFGSTNPSGTLAITSKPIADGVHADLNASFGSFGTRALGLQTSYSGSKNSFATGMDFLTTEGDFSFFDNNGTPKNPNDDAVTKRKNNAHCTGHIQGRWHLSPNPNIRLTAIVHGFLTNKGVPGLENYQSESAKLNQTETLGTFKWETTPDFSETSHWQNQIYARYILTRFSDPNGEIGLGKAQNTHDTTFIVGNTLFWRKTISEKASYGHLLHYSYESFLPKDKLNTAITGSVSRRHRLEATFEPEWNFGHNTLSLTAKLQPGVSISQVNNDDPSLNSSATFANQNTQPDFSASISAKKLLGKDVFLKTTLAREMRLPQFVEMFGDQGFVLGNPELKSERLLKGETGLVWQPAQNALRIEATTFAEWGQDLIEFELHNGVAQADNLGKTRILGLETFAHAELLPFLAVNLSYTFLDARDLNNDRFLIGRPRHNAHLTLAATFEDFSATSDLGFEDGKALDSLNNTTIENRWLWDIELNYTLRKDETLSLEAKNLTDSQTEDAIGFPLPGRSFFLKWQKRW